MNYLRCAIAIFGLTLSASGGAALRFHYQGIDGGQVADLTNHRSFPNQPTLVQPVTTALEDLHEKGDSFGTSTRGFIEAPQTGNYVFLLASDDDSAFWLSTNADSSNRRLVASNVGFVNPRNYTAKPSQQSEPIHLNKGQKYYFELLHKDHVGYDHISLGWRLPDGTMEAPLPAFRLLPLPFDEDYNVLEQKPRILTDYLGERVATLTNIVAKEGDAAVFSLTVEANPPPSFQWMRNHVPIPKAILSSYTLPQVHLTNDTDLFSVIVSNRHGTVKAEAMLNVFQDNLPPVILSSLLLRSNRLALLFSKPVEADSASRLENYEIDGCNPSRIHPADNPQLLLLQFKDAIPKNWNRLQVRQIKDQAQPPNTILPAAYSVEPHLKAKVSHAESAVELAPGMADFTSGLTIALWARPGMVRKGAPFVEFSNNGHDFIRFGRLDTSQNMVLEIADKGFVAVNGIELGSWQHFAATVDRQGIVSLYKDGSTLITMPLGTPRVLWRTNNYAGRSSNSDRDPFQGELNDLRVYGRTLPPSEIKLLSREVPSQ